MQIEPGKEAVWFPGFARYAKATGANIYALKVKGIDTFWPTHPDNGGPQKINWRAEVRAAFSEAINPNDYKSIDELVAATRRIHADLPLPS
jgi:hypothetical protein